VITPILQRSTGFEYFLPFNISGAVYPGLPQTVVNKSVGSSMIFEIPKSTNTNLSTPSSLNNKFSGLISYN